MKNNVFLKTLLLVSLACIIGSSNAQIISEGTCTISRTFYKNDGTPLQGVRVIVTKVVKNGRIISRGPVTYLSDASGAVSFTVPQGSKVYMDSSGFNTPGGVPVNIPDSSGWTYTFDSPQPLGSMRAAELIVQRNDLTVGDTPKDTLDFSTTFNVTASPDNEANISINHDSLKARPGSKLTYLHNLFVDRALSAHDETSLANAKTKALDSNFVLLVPPDYTVAAMTFTNRDTALKLINYATINITASDTIPAGASIVMAGKGRFNISSGKTLTFASGSRFDGGMQRRFIGSGTVKFQEDVVSEVYPQWWGALGDSSTQCVTAFQSAVNSGVKRIRVKTPPGTYVINDSIRIRSNVDFIGENACLVSSDTTKKVLTAGPLAKNIKIFGFTVRYNPRKKVRTDANKSAFYLNEVDTLEVSHNRILFAPGMGIQIIACKTVKVQFNHVENTLADGIHITNGLNSDTGRNLWSADFIITNNTVFNVGDDHIACVSYKRPNLPTDPAYVAWQLGGSQEINRNGVIANNIVKGGLTKHKCRGISVLGGQDIIIANNLVEGHPVQGDTNNTVMVSGILIQGGTIPFRFHRPNRIKIIGNTIKDTYAPHFDTEQGGIKVQGADSVEIIGNAIDWSPNQAGIFIRATSELAVYGYKNAVKDVLISNNVIQNPRAGVRILSTDSTGGSINGFNQRILIKDNKFSNTRYYAVNVDSVTGISIEGNHFYEVNTSATTNIDAIRVNRFDQNLAVINNRFWSSAVDTVRRAINASDPVVSGSSAKYFRTPYFREQGNIYDLTANLKLVEVPTAASKFHSQAEKRQHYGTAAPTTGTWAVGDMVINGDPGIGEVAYWICTAAGTPGTWVHGPTISNGLSVKDTTGYVLNQAGVATITGGSSHIRLDSYAAAALDTVTELNNGITGQLVMVSSRNANRDLVLIDDDNKLDLNQEYVRLHSPKDVLFLLAYSANQWKQVGYFSGNTRQNRFSVDDTVGVVLAATGTATVEGIGNLILDTFGAAALDTVTTLTGTAGQVIYISTRAGNRDIRFLDSGNFSLAAERLLNTVYDVLVLKATTATTWKEVSFSDNQ